MSKITTKKIAIYGKGGIGKSTTTSNISAALVEAGYKVMQFGCDPKSDSTNTLRDGEYIPSVLELMRENRRVDAHQAIFRGFGGVYCVEAGGPQPGVGCAGRGIISAVQLLKQQGIFEELELDYVIFDVLGDVVCGGFAVPIREGIADHVFTVSSADFMAIYAANNLFRGILSYSNSGGALLGGVIANSINTPFHREILDDFVHRTKTQIMEYIPRSLTVTQAEPARQDNHRGGARISAGRHLSPTCHAHRRAHRIEGSITAQFQRTAHLVVRLGGATNRKRTRASFQRSRNCGGGLWRLI